MTTHLFVSLTSRLFGFIKIDSNENMPKKLLLIKVTASFFLLLFCLRPSTVRSNLVVLCHTQAIQVYEKRSSTVTDPIVQAKCFTMLGHWHLLLNDYNKCKTTEAFSLRSPFTPLSFHTLFLSVTQALSFYQKFYEYDLEDKRVSAT